MAIYFSRDTKVYLEWKNAGAATGVVWEIPVLDGYSFTQANETQEITLSEASTQSGTVSKRGRVMFNTALAPAEWSFTTYMRPFITTGVGANGAPTADAAYHHAVEEALWAALTSKATVDTSSPAGGALWTNGPTNGGSPANALLIDFSNSNKPDLATFDLFFSFDDSGTPQVYKLNDAVVNSATINFDIEGLATIEWSGFASDISESSKPTRTIFEAVTSTNTFIRHRLSEFEFIGNPGSPTGNYNNIVLTGGSVTFENNISYLTPEELGIVNTPVAHVTGARSISGTVTAYLDTADNAIAELFNDMVNDKTTTQHDFDLTLYIGGIAGTPRVEIDINQGHVEIPSHVTEDVLSMEFNFHGLGTGIDQTDEVNIRYIGVTPA